MSDTQVRIVEDFERTRELTRKRIQQRKKKRQREVAMHIALCTAVVIILLFIIASVLKAFAPEEAGTNEKTLIKYIEEPPAYTREYLTPNEYSRPETPLEEVTGIVIHYTANPGTTAQQNRSYFEGLAESKLTKASSHFIVGMAGEIIQCIPMNEIAYASNERNADTISIECCIDNEAGKFSEDTYDAVVELTAWLVGKFDLEIDDVIRHYDVTGKNCPKYFVEHESAWVDFKMDVETYIDTYGVEKISH